MKKIVLLLTIACAGQLYGMEAENIGGLPAEIQKQITQMAIASSKNVDEAIEMIKKLSLAFGISYKKPVTIDDFIEPVLQFGNFDDFTKLVIRISDRENKSLPLYLYGTDQMVTPYQVAKQFDTPMAKRYLASYEMLRQAVRWSNNELGINMGLKPILARHKDIAKVDPQILFLAYFEAREKAPEVIKLLLEHGADPNAINMSTNNGSGMTLLQYLEEKSSRLGLSQRDQQIKLLLEEAMKK